MDQSLLGELAIIKGTRDHREGVWYYLPLRPKPPRGYELHAAVQSEKVLLHPPSSPATSNPGQLRRMTCGARVIKNHRLSTVETSRR